MKTKEFFLLLLIIAVGVLLYHIDTGQVADWAWTWDFEWDGPFFDIGEMYTFQESRELPPPLAGTMEVVNAHGSVDIQGSPTDKINITLVKKIRRRNEEEARETAEALKLVIEDDGQKMLLTTNRHEFRKKRFETHFTVSVPEGLRVTVKNSYGTVKILMTGDTTVSNTHGAVEARDIRGALSLQNSYEDVIVEGVASDCTLRCGYASVTAARIQGKIQVDTSYGSVHLEDVNGNVTLTAPHSEITAVHLAGTVKVESSYDTIDLTDVGTAQVDGHHSRIRVEGVGGMADISNSYGRTEVKNVLGNVSIQGHNTEVLGQLLAGPEISVTTSYRDIVLKEFTGRTTVVQKHGSLRLEPGLLTAELRVQGEYCPIYLAWPAGGRFPFEGQTRNGTIRWGVSTPPSLNTSNGVSLLKAFQEETGKPQVLLSTTYADITVEESSARVR